MTVPVRSAMISVHDHELSQVQPPGMRLESGRVVLDLLNERNAVVLRLTELF